MKNDPFSLPNLALVLFSIGITVYLVHLYKVATRNASAKEIALFKKPIRNFVLLYGIYFIGIVILAINGFFAKETIPPRFAVIFVMIAAALVTLSVGKLKRSLSFLHFVPPYLLVIIQSFRILIELVLVEAYKEGIIPVELSLHGHNFDILVGILALSTGFLLMKKDRLAFKAGIAFNILGIISLANIISIGTLSFPSGFRIYETNYFPTYFPGILIVYIAPVALYLHVLSLRQLVSLQKKFTLKS